jgi:hypothetical protein
MACHALTTPGPGSALPGTYSLRSASASKEPSTSDMGKSCPTVTVNRPQIFPRAFVAVADHVPSSVVPGAARGSRCTMSRATLLRGLRARADRPVRGRAGSGRL